MFSVFDNQSPVSHFNEFERDDDLPLQLGLLLDTSDSVKRVLPQEKRAAIDFLDQRDAAADRRRFRHRPSAATTKYGRGSTADRQQLIECYRSPEGAGLGNACLRCTVCRLLRTGLFRQQR